MFFRHSFVTLLEIKYKDLTQIFLRQAFVCKCHGGLRCVYANNYLQRDAEEVIFPVSDP